MTQAVMYVHPPAQGSDDADRLCAFSSLDMAEDKVELHVHVHAVAVRTFPPAEVPCRRKHEGFHGQSPEDVVIYCICMFLSLRTPVAR